jgi:hypothetical protein
MKKEIWRDAMKDKAFPSLLVVLLTLSAFFILGCESAPEPPVLGSSFNNTWTSEGGRTVRIIGIAKHQAGTRAEFLIEFDNPGQNDIWADDYRVILIDIVNGSEWEIDQGEFTVQARSAIELPVAVQIPPAASGQLRLEVLTASGGVIGVQLTVAN